MKARLYLKVKGNIMVENFFENIPDNSEEEIFTEIFKHRNIKVERIVSTGQATPQGDDYNQDWDEWVLLLEGRATLSFTDENRIFELTKGSHLFIPAGTRHRVEHTSSKPPAIWLALHINQPA